MSKGQNWWLFFIAICLIVGLLPGCGDSCSYPLMPFSEPRHVIPYDAILEYDEIADKAPYTLSLGTISEVADFDVYFKDYKVAGNHIFFTESYLCPRDSYFHGQHALYWLKDTSLWSRPMPTRQGSGIHAVFPEITTNDVASVFAEHGWDINDFRPEK